MTDPVTQQVTTYISTQAHIQTKHSQPAVHNSELQIHTNNNSNSIHKSQDKEPRLRLHTTTIYIQLSITKGEVQHNQSPNIQSDCCPNTATEPDMATIQQCYVEHDLCSENTSNSSPRGKYSQAQEQEQIQCIGEQEKQKSPQLGSMPQHKRMQ